MFLLRSVLHCVESFYYAVLQHCVKIFSAMGDEIGFKGKGETQFNGISSKNFEGGNKRSGHNRHIYHHEAAAMNDGNRIG